MNSVQMQLPQKMFGVRNHQILEGPLGFPKTKQRKGGLCSQSTGTQVGGQKQRGQSYPGYWVVPGSVPGVGGPRRKDWIHEKARRCRPA